MQAIDEGATSFLTTEYKYVGIFMVCPPLGIGRCPRYRAVPDIKSAPPCKLSYLALANWVLIFIICSLCCLRLRACALCRKSGCVKESKLVAIRQGGCSCAAEHICRDHLHPSRLSGWFQGPWPRREEGRTVQRHLLHFVVCDWRGHIRCLRLFGHEDRHICQRANCAGGSQGSRPCVHDRSVPCSICSAAVLKP